MRLAVAVFVVLFAQSSGAYAESDYEKAMRENAAQNQAVQREYEYQARKAEHDEAIKNFDRREELQKAFTRALDGHDIEAMRRARDALMEEESHQARERLLKEGPN